MLLIVTVVLTFMPTCAFGESVPTISLSEQSEILEVGRTINIDVSLSGNPGIIGGRIDVEFDKSCFKLIGVTNTDQTLTATYNGYTKFPITSGKYTLSWDGDLLEEDIHNDGLLATLKFEVIDSATPGKKLVKVTDTEFGNYAMG